MRKKKHTSPSKISESERMSQNQAILTKKIQGNLYFWKISKLNQSNTITSLGQ